MFYMDNSNQKQGILFNHVVGRVAYHVPREAKSLFLLAVAGGGNGGNGFSRAAGNPGGGGGGGGAGAVGCWYGPTFLIPDTIFVTVGGPAAGSGVFSTVSLGSSFNIISAAAGLSGGNGTASAAGAAGSGSGGPGVQNIGPHMAAVAWGGSNLNGGGIGGAHTGAIGASITYGGLGIPGSGAAGGAGCTTTDFDGGSIIGGDLFGTIPGGVAGDLSGSPGYVNWDLMLFSGGAGGASNNSGVGGSGGQGGPGCGGGGGGAGVTGGIGGRGGNGYVLIVPMF